MPNQIAVRRLITRENYAEKMDSSLAPWPLDERNINGNERLKEVINPGVGFELYGNMIRVPQALLSEVDKIPYEELAVKLVLDAWHLTKCPVGTKEREIVLEVQERLGYTFVNEWLIMQAFTRRSYKESQERAFAKMEAAEARSAVRNEGIEDYEVLELIGDSLISAALLKLQVDQFSYYASWDSSSKHIAFFTNEGRMTKEKEKFSDKTYLAECCKLFGFDKYIRAGEGDDISGAGPKEDVIEALIGAVAIDSNWNMEIITRAVENLLEPQFEINMFAAEDGFGAVNRWHQKKFGCKAPFKTYPFTEDFYLELLNNSEAVISENSPTGILTLEGRKLEDGDQYPSFITTLDIEDVGLFVGTGETKSEARSDLAYEARNYLIDEGLWWDVRDCGFEPNLMDSINQLQELYQKKYITSKPEYRFDSSEIENYGILWYCQLKIGDDIDTEYVAGGSKKEAKKRAALCALIEIFKGSGLYNEEWDYELGESEPVYGVENLMDGQETILYTFLDWAAFIYGHLSLEQIVEIWNSGTGMDVPYYNFHINTEYAHSYTCIDYDITKIGIDSRTINRIINAQNKYGLRILNRAEFSDLVNRGYVRTSGSRKLVKILREEYGHSDPDAIASQLWHEINQGASLEVMRDIALGETKGEKNERVEAALDQMYAETMIMTLAGHSRNELGIK